jgi:hypothetical protein
VNSANADFGFFSNSKAKKVSFVSPTVSDLNNYGHKGIMTTILTITGHCTAVSHKGESRTAFN